MSSHEQQPYRYVHNRIIVLLTHIRLMDSSVIRNWMSSFLIKGMSGKFLLVSYRISFNLNKKDSD